MMIWDTIRRLSGAGRPKKAARISDVRPGRRDLLGSLRTRSLRMETFEQRVLLSITSNAGFEDLEQIACPIDDYSYLSSTLSNAVYRASDLSGYDQEILAATYQWVVGVDQSEADAPQLASSLNADFLLYAPILTNATIWEFPESMSWVNVANTLEAAQGVDYYYPLVAKEAALDAVPNDPLFSEQWHLQNTGQSGGTVGADCKVVMAWDLVTGAGVVIGIVDQGMEGSHPDLVGNFRADLSYDFVGNDPDPSPVAANENHGTSVAGVASAVGNNGVGVSGTGPGANLAGLRLLGGPSTDQTTANALIHQNQSIDIYNNSWGWTIWLQPEGPLTLAAIESGVTDGRDGLGNIYVFSAGNDRLDGENVNWNTPKNLRTTIAVAAIDHNGQYSYYSSPGAPVFISGYSGSYGADITTTDRTGEAGYNSTGTGDGDPLPDINYTSTFSGTSSAAPLISGIISLILEANPDLTYRDVQHILAESAFRNDPNNSDWMQNGAGFWVNHNYGFGAADAAAAVNLALEWENVSEEISTGSDRVMVNATIPDANPTGVRSTVTLDDSVNSIEWVEVTVDIVHSSPGDLQIVLVSPDGTESRLSEPVSMNWSFAGNTFANWTLTSCHHWGEAAEGEWTLIVRDLLSGTSGTLRSWELNVFGTAEPEEPGPGPGPGPVEVAGPELVSLIPNQGGTIVNGTVLHVAPRDLTLLFNEEQVIDPATLSAIQIVRAGGDRLIGNANDVAVNHGWIGIGERPNEVIVRFAETLPDDMYMITIIGEGGEGDVVLMNVQGGVFHQGENLSITFTLDLGAQVVSVVPQPTYRDAAGNLQQHRDQIEVYFNDDTLNVASAQNTTFYRLSLTNETATTHDDVEIYPTSAVYDAAKNKVVLTFAGDLADFGAGAYRLRIGDEYQEIATSTTDAYVVGDTLAAATNMGVLGAASQGQSIVISSAIEALPYDLQFPGAISEVGHRRLPSSVLSESHYRGGLTADDDTYGIPTLYYNFRHYYGNFGGPRYNVLTTNDQAKDRVREVFELYGAYLGVQFVEDTSGQKGFSIVLGDMRVLNPFIDTGPGGTLSLSSSSMAILDAAETWTYQYGENFFERIMYEVGHMLGLGESADLSIHQVMGSSSDDDYYTAFAERVFPGNEDIVHGQYVYRPDSIDVDVYRFEIERSGTFSAETIAERLAATSLLDSVVTLHDAQGKVLARNDDYHSEDSYLEVELTPGTYYVVVTSTGNTEYDLDVAGSGLGGTTQGNYDLRLSFVPSVVETGRHLVDATGTQFDGDADGVPGGVYNYWFDVQTLEKTVFVDKTSDGVGQLGSLDNPYRDIDDALAAATPGDIVRIVGNRDRTFDEQMTYDVSAKPAGTAVGDVTGDGIADIIVTNEDDGSVSLLRGVGDGTYWTAITYLVGTRPGAVALADLDNDGDLDVVVVNQGSNTVSLLMNNGSGVFDQQITRFAGSLPSGVALADLNGDGVADIVVTNRGSNDVSVLLSDPANMYRDQVRYGLGDGASPAGLALADLNNDGHIDIVVANEGTNTVAVLTNEDDGTFLPAVSFTAGAAPSSVAVADFDGDGNRDVVVANRDENSVSVLRGLGDSTFASQVKYAVGGQPGSLGVADLDGDGASDIVTANRADDTVSVLFGVGNATFEVHVLYDVGDQPTGLTLADIDGDGRPDIVTANQGHDEISVLRARRNQAYLIGRDKSNRVLADGVDLRVPRGVTVMIDAGAVLKLSRANINVGSSSLNVDASEGALQVLGTPEQNVYFTSYYDRSLGSWTDQSVLNPSVTSGDWGGLVFRNNLDYQEGRPVLESEGVFLNYVNHAEIRYGGGGVSVNGVNSTYNPLHMVESRPTLTFNTIIRSADAAMSADPNSFADTKFHGDDFTADYDRIGPDIHGNLIVDNSINGLFVRIRTEAGAALDKLNVSARWDDTDIVHVVEENLLIGGTPGGPTDDGTGQLTARFDARLAIDPGIIVKLNYSRIETQIGAQLLAEGTAALPIVFTSKFDDSYGMGGTFDTDNGNRDANELQAEPGDWGGLYFGPVSSGGIDHAVIAYGGGETRIPGGFADFNAVEIHQADVRLANSTLAFNSGATTAERAGRPATSASVIFVRGAQPVVVNNVIRDNTVHAMSVNANALAFERVADWGRATGFLDAFVQYSNNHGPLVRGNALSNNGVNGMEVRGEVLSTDSVWDDTDIVHVVYDEIVVPNFHTFGGLRLQSSSSASLVVKLKGDNAGITALGTPGENNERIGGTLQIIGAPGYPVVMTSLHDDSIGAGVDPWGNPQNDTDNAVNTPNAGDWRSVKLERYMNDRNVAVVLEAERAYGGAGANDSPYSAESLGGLARDLKGGDENLRLGFDVHGFIAIDDPNDADVYSFTAQAGTEVWIDIDRTTMGLDSIVELIDADGNILAASLSSTAEEAGLISPQGLAKTMNRDAWSDSGDMYTTNVHDAGMRLVLPGVAGSQSLYYVRVRSADNTGDGQGDSSGAYQLQIRLAEKQEIPGSTVSYSSIRYATDGIEVLGAPTNSPLLGDTAEIEFKAPTTVATPATANVMGWFTLTSVTRGTEFNDVRIIFEDRGAIGDWAIVDYDHTHIDGGQVYKALIIGIDAVAGTTLARIVAAINADGTFTAQLTAAGATLIGGTGLAATTAGGDDDTEPNNDNFLNAEYLGNLLDSNQGSLTVSGRLQNQQIGIDTVYDVDWYSFTVDMDKLTASGSGDWNVVFDIDYADGIGRPDTSLYVYEPVYNEQREIINARLIYVAGDSSIADDLVDPLSSASLQNLGRGSSGTGDPLLGPVVLPEGGNNADNMTTYFVAITSRAMVPTAFDHEETRHEPVNSVTRIADDNVYTDGHGASGVAGSPRYALFTDIEYADQLNLHIDDYHLKDVVMYVSLGKDMFAFNPFTGEYQTDVTGAAPGVGTPSNTRLLPGAAGATYYDDIAIRNDGKLLSFTSSAPATTAAQGNYTHLSTADGILLAEQINNIVAFVGDPNEPEDEIALPTGVQISALIPVIENRVRYTYAIGHTELIPNLLFKYDEFGGVIGATGTAVPTSVVPWRIIDGVDGKITGLDFVDGVLHGVTDTGKLLTLEGFASPLSNLEIIDYEADEEDPPEEMPSWWTNAEAEGVPPYWQADNLVLTLGDQVTEVADLFTIFALDPEAGDAPSFTGLTVGSANVEAPEGGGPGAYSVTLFATDNMGGFYAVQPKEDAWEQAPVFIDGEAYVVLGITDPNTGEKQPIPGASGVAFSTLDYNLWHATSIRAADDGHDINVTPDGSRPVPFYPSPGGASFWFGFEDNFFPETANYADDDPVLNTYDLPGGAHGTLTTNVFSLAGYQAQDSPLLTFEYFLETDGGVHTNIVTDSARVYISNDGANWTLLATNINTPADVMADSDDLPGMYYMHDGTGQWHQAVINLSDYVGMDNLRLKFEFATAGSVNADSVYNNWNGAYLRSVVGSAIRDGDTFEMKDTAQSPTETHFEYDMGYSLIAPNSAGMFIQDGETFTIRNQAGTEFTFEFDKDGTITSDHIRVPVNDSDSAFAVARSIGVAIDSVTLVEPSPLPGVFAWVNGDRVNLQGVYEVVQSPDAVMALDGNAPETINYRYLRIPEIVFTGDPETEVRVYDGETLTVTDSVGNSVTFEFDKDWQVTPGNVAVRYVDNGPAHYDNEAVIAQKLAAAINKAVADGLLVDVAAAVNPWGEIPPDSTSIRLEGVAGLAQNADLTTPADDEPKVIFEDTVLVAVHAGMSATEVAIETALAVDEYYTVNNDGTVANPDILTSVKRDQDVLYVLKHVVTYAGPLAYSATSPGNSPDFNAARQNGVGTQFTQNVRGQDNAYEGWYVDNVMIGFRERGLMATDAPADAGFKEVGPGLSITEGYYQLQIRLATDYGVPLSASYDTNDRHTDEITLFAPAGGAVFHGQSFTVSDGLKSQVFVFVGEGIPYTPTPGVIYVSFRADEPAFVLAQKITAAINSSSAINVNASNIAQGPVGSERVDLVGATSVEGIQQLQFSQLGQGPSDVQVVDLNYDGFPDVVTTNETDGTISVVMQRPSLLRVLMYSPVFYEVGSKPSALAIADLNGDGVYDIVTSNAGDGTVSVLLGNPLATQTDRYLVVPEQGQIEDGELLTIVDEFDNVVTFEFDSDANVVRPDYVRVAFDAAPYSRTAVAQSLLEAIEQAVTDGRLVGVAVSINGARLRVDGVSETAKSEGAAIEMVEPTIVVAAHTTAAFKTQVVYDVGAEPSDVAIADLDGDGVMDIIATNREDNTISILYGNGDGTFQAARTLDVGRAPASVAVADLNGDGVGDIVVANSLDYTVSVFLSLTDTVYATPVEYSVGRLPVDVELADIDNSGTLDIVTANRADGTVSILLGDVDGTFADGVAFAVGREPVDVEVAHLGIDGFLDIAVANYSSNQVTVLMGTGSAGNLMGSPASYATRMTPSAVAIGDLDGNGLNDLITSDKQADQIVLNANYLTYFAIPEMPPGIWNVGYPKYKQMVGDKNDVRVQGQLILECNEILFSAEHGIKVAAGERDDHSHPGAALPLIVANTQRLVPGITIENNLIVQSGVAGIHFSGDSNVEGATAAVPFGKIVNNTIYGNGIDATFELLPPGDVVMPPNDDESSSWLDIGFELDFYGNTYTQMYVNNNGNITFDYPLWDFTPEGFPQNMPIIAPFWGDVDTRAGGGEVRVAYGTSARDNPVVQIDWIDVGYFAMNGDKRNTFTLYIEDDPLGDIVVFVYHDMQWTTGDVDSDVWGSGFGGAGAQIGFDAGDYQNFVSVMRPNSAADLADLMDPGTYIWRLVGEAGAPVAASSDTGILVTNNASPTILNNIVANLDTGIHVDATCGTTILGATVYQGNGINTVGISESATAVILGRDDPLFVDPDNGNFYLAAGSKAIDSSVNSLEERVALAEVYDPLGIARSPILAPDYDLYGQQRADDPSAQPPSGSGSNVFKDRGAIDRVDFDRPTAIIIDPLDNDPIGIDLNPAIDSVFVIGEPTPVISIQLKDNLSGAGIYDYSVQSGKVHVYVNDRVEPLVAGVDYFFRYDATNDIISLIAAAGLWEHGRAYTIILDNGPDGITDIAGNPLQGNQLDGSAKYVVALTYLDFGDAPDPIYPTKLENDGARHLLIGDYYLGNGVTGEADANLAVDRHDNPINDATGDAMDDGVVFTSALLMDSTVTLRVKASRAGYLNAWIDLNGDGDFDDPDEKVIGVSLARGWNDLSFVLPEGEFIGETFARFRFTSAAIAAGVGPTGLVVNGEVEDYKVSIVDVLRDYGDAPSPYPTLLADDGARHALGSGLFMGSRVDDELDGQPDKDALGDDKNGIIDESGPEPVVLDDEDGVEFTDFLIPGQTASLKVTASMGGGYLNAWIDFNGDGIWTEDEKIADGKPLSAGVNTVVFVVPSTAQGTIIGHTFARFRLGTEASLEPTGAALDGEVEDYKVIITEEPRDYGDAPRSYLTVENSEAAFAQLVLPGHDNDMLITAVTLGTEMNDVEIQIVNDRAVGDIAFVTYDADEKVLTIDVDPLRTTANAVVTAVNTQQAARFTAELSDLVDKDNDGTGLISSLGTVGITAHGEDGAGEDAAYHVLWPAAGQGARNLYLGSLVDAELDGQAHPTALGDDNSDLDDEDGVTLPETLMVGQQTEITVEVHMGEASTAYLSAWIDLNIDGLFTEDEQVLFDVTVVDGLQTVSVTIPMSAAAGTTFARFRLSTQEDLSFGGRAQDGEVEDYEVVLTRGTAGIAGWVFEDRNNNGIFDAAEKGIAEVTVFIDVNENGILDRDIYGVPIEPFVVTMEDDLSTTDVNETGHYEFDGLIGRPEKYVVRVYDESFENWVLTFPDEMVWFGDGSHGNADHSYDIFLEANEEHENVNFGSYRKPSVFVSDVMVVEGHENFTEVQVTITLTDSFGAPIEVNYHTIDGTATTQDGDYIPATGKVTIDPRDTPPPTWDLHVLTSNSTNDYDFGVSGNYVVWEEFDGNDWEIFLAVVDVEHGTFEVIQLTDNDTNDRFPHLRATKTGVNVVWVGNDGNDDEIFAYSLNNGVATHRQVTDNSYQDRDPRVSDSLITWWGNDAGDNEIFVFEIDKMDDPNASPVNLTDNTLDDRSPQISGRNIVWMRGAGGTDTEIMAYYGDVHPVDEPNVIRVTNNSQIDQWPRIDGDKIVWESQVGLTNYEIYLYEMKTAATTRITTNSTHDRYPDIAGNNVVWRGNTGSNWEIYHYNTVAKTEPRNISNTPMFSEDEPRIEGNQVVWRAFNGAGYDIYYYDLNLNTGAVNVTNTAGAEWKPAVSDSLLAWRAADGADYDIVIGIKNEPVASQTVTLRVVGDRKYELDEYFLFAIEVDEDLIMVRDGKHEAVVTILNDDGVLDFGDAPSPYPTLLVDNGARHRIVSGVYLGDPAGPQSAYIDAELDGQPTANADGDDRTTSDDEQGVVFNTAIAQGTTASVTVTASTHGFIDAWLDFNRDGDWDDLGEHIFEAAFVEPGANTLYFPVPEGAVIGDSYARFRFSTIGGLAYTGQADNGEVEDYMVPIVARPPVVDRVVQLTGTSGDDLIEIFAGDTVVVRINGAEYSYLAANIDTINFDGGAGVDTVVFHGSTADESIEMWTNRATFQGPQGGGYVVNTSNVELMRADGGGGLDNATLRGGAGNDAFEGRPGLAEMNGLAYSLTVTDFDQVLAVAGAGGADTAVVRGSTGNDTFVGRPKYGSVTTSGGDIITAEDFHTTRAFSEGHADGDPAIADRAYLYDSNASDTLMSTPTQVNMQPTLGGGYYLEANDFRFVEAYSENGGEDYANLYDSPEADSFIGNPGYAQLKGKTAGSYQVTANNFRYVAAIGSGNLGDDANLYDSPGSDTFEADPTYALLRGANFYLRADNFPKVTAFGSNGGEDVVQLYDSPNDDVLVASPNDMTLTGPGFVISAKDFQHVVAFAGQGNDTATFFGNSGADTFIGRPGDARLTTGGNTFRAYGFDSVMAYGKGGDDEAYLYDTSLGDLLVAKGKIGDGEDAWAELSNNELNLRLWVADFEYVWVNQTGSGDKKDIDPEVDFIFTQGLWEDL